MLHPKTSFLVLMEGTATHATIPAVPATNLQRLTSAAIVLNVPTVPAGYPTGTGPGQVAALAGIAPSTSLVAFDPSAVDWVSTPLGRAIALTGRSQMIVCGFWLEEAITLLTLKCLSLGIDAYLPVDATAAVNPKNCPAAHARLTQAGAVPTTTEQVLREWGALCGDAAIQSKLISLLDSKSASSP